MKICAISDLHGNLPSVPACDLLIIGGDICPVYNHKPLFQAHWLRDEFSLWLEDLPVDNVVAIWGNHDYIGESKFAHLTPSLDWKLLTDTETTIDTISFWGSPWQLRFFDWAFNLDEDDLSRKYALIPDNINVIISHGPPQGYGDLAPPHPKIRADYEHVGSPSLTQRILEIKPLLVITGHIHNAYGVHQMDGCDTLVANASLLDEKYRLVNKPLLFEIDNGKVERLDF